MFRKDTWILKSGNVKAYAFYELVNRENPNCRQILEQHLNDITTFQYFSGCLKSESNVNLFYLKCLQEKLSSQDINRYKTKISTYYKKEDWEFIEATNSF